MTRIMATYDINMAIGLFLGEHVLIPSLCSSQAKKKYYDTELESLEKNQKQTIEKMETDHAVKLRDETKRIRSEQDRDYNKFQDQMKRNKKEV